MRFALLAAALIISACASQPAQQATKNSYPNLEAAIQSAFVKTITELPEGERQLVGLCFAESVAGGIPIPDRAQMLDALNSEQFDRDDLALFDTYYPIKTDGAPNPTAQARAEKNAAAICPDTLSRYPEMFT